MNTVVSCRSGAGCVINRDPDNGAILRGTDHAFTQAGGPECFCPLPLRGGKGVAAEFCGFSSVLWQVENYEKVCDMYAPA